MSRDMKPKKAPARKSSGGTLVGVFIGLIMGVIVALGVAWYINRASMPFSTAKAPATPPVTESPSAAKAAVAPAPAAEPTPATPAPLPGKPGDSVDKPRFDFYKILPGNADALPEPKGDGAKDAKKEAPKETFFLQAGSFQKPGDADNQKANLAMLGMEATVQQVMVGDKVWFRVRLGPYRKIDEVNKARSELAKAGVEANLVKNND